MFDVGKKVPTTAAHIASALGGRSRSVHGAVAHLTRASAVRVIAMARGETRIPNRRSTLLLFA